MEQKKLGRPKLKTPTKPISWRIPIDVHQLLEKRQKELREQTGVNLSIGKVLEGIVRNSVV